MIALAIVGCHKEAPTIVADDARVAASAPAVATLEMDADAGGSLLVVVRADQSVLVDGKPGTIQQLEKSAPHWLALEPDLQIRIAADAQTPHARVVEIIDALKRGGVKKFSLMVVPKPASS